MFRRLLIANRGEIAVRIARTCHELGVEVVAVHSDVDAEARHARAADQVVHLPGVTPPETYLNVGAILAAASRSGAEAIHPGYGFLSERADAARAVISAGLAWVGPPPDAILAAGDKIRARRLAEAVGVAPVPGTSEAVREAADALAFGHAHGYPIAVKAAGGGGGRGLKVAESADEVAAAMESAVRESEAYFGSGDVYLERYLTMPKHIEIQVLAPRPGGAMSLGARDCSLQRRHQKLIEETPPPRHADIVPAMGEAALAVAGACGYVNAGTVEFLVDEDGRFYFLEINARLQVEHTITEEVLGLDLVAAQLRIAAGDDLGFGAQDLRPHGHAIECRINAEDPARGFMPGPGRIKRFREPTGPGIRLDSGYGQGDEVPRAYDSLLAKLVAWGATREEARDRMMGALREIDIAGVPTTIPAHLVLMDNPEFVLGTYTTRTVEAGALASLTAPRPASASDVTARLWHPAIPPWVRRAREASSGRGSIVAPMHGTILKVLVSVGDWIDAGEPVAVLEAMKMETYVASATSGVVQEIEVQAGEVVEAGDVVAIVG
jgi:acetyl-CoA/propionyl-CoA carboxylase biotin carboxyl carrier protein